MSHSLIQLRGSADCWGGELRERKTSGDKPHGQGTAAHIKHSRPSLLLSADIWSLQIKRNYFRFAVKKEICGAARKSFNKGSSPLFLKVTGGWHNRNATQSSGFPAVRVFPSCPARAHYKPRLIDAGWLSRDAPQRHGEHSVWNVRVKRSKTVGVA